MRPRLRARERSSYLAPRDLDAHRIEPELKQLSQPRADGSLAQPERRDLVLKHWTYDRYARIVIQRD